MDLSEANKTTTVEAEHAKKLGETIRQLRKKKGLSQVALCRANTEHQICSERHMRGIEKGRAVPSTHVLNQLLKVLEIGFEEFTSLVYGENLSKFEHKFERVIRLLFQGKNEQAQDKFSELKREYESKSDNVKIAQGLLFCQGVFTKIYEKDPVRSLFIFMDALSLTVPTLINKNREVLASRISSRVFSRNEYRLLNIIANTKLSMGKSDETSKILSALLSSLVNKCEDDIFKKENLPSIFFNLSNTLSKREMHKEASDVSDSGIQFCVEMQVFKLIAKLHFNKARASFHLDDKMSATKHFALSRDAFRGQGNEREAQHVIDEAEEIYGISLSNTS
jgi:transcriptional regulator with XRE-family HTH domain